VERSLIVTDTVKRGELLREVQGQGTLVPEQIRWISAAAAARVDTIAVHSGTAVEPDTVILTLANPDLELQTMEAERQLATARAELTNLTASSRSQRLAQESAIASLRSELADAKRRAGADASLAEQGFLSKLEMGQSSGKADELRGRVEFEEKRLDALGQGLTAQLSAHRAQVDRLAAIARLRQGEKDALQVKAGVAGVLQELPLQVGQWVSPGTLLAKVAQPEKLKAEIKVPEILAKDVQNGQKAVIDTRNGLATGRVGRIDPAVQGGTVKVDVTFSEALPLGARPDQSVEGTIELDRIPDTLYVGRPAGALSVGNTTLFRLVDGGEAARTAVSLGRTSARAVEITGGLKEGDQIILSDMSAWDSHPRIRLK
jgi:multidrug resistance efflux pump